MKYSFFVLTLIFWACLPCGKIFAQNNVQNELNRILAIENVERRIMAADTFCDKIADIIKTDAKAPKIDAPQRISQLFSNDKNVGIYTWSIPTERGMYKYYGIVKSPKGVVILNDVNINSEYMTDQKLTDGKWYGAVYYDIVETGMNGKTSYTLLGNDLKGILSNKKIIDILNFDDDGKPEFGAEMFYKPNCLRLIFEYNARSSMHLVYENKMKMIVYSFLIPMNTGFEGDYRFYVADTSCDGLIYKNGKWTLVENVVFEGKNTYKK
ncbi:MAG: hypothetical protein LBP63_05345 [Prevotellaceae bacterium]|jgi:hypothetical protein|nr:hypothetical protein [Prevotellaceae bacterium]